MKRFLAIFCILIFLLPSFTIEAANSSVSLKKSKITLNLTKNQTYKVTKLLKGYKSSTMKISTSIDGKKCITVKNGVIYPKKKGTTKLVITIRNKKTDKTIFSKSVTIKVKKTKKTTSNVSKTSEADNLYIKANEYRYKSDFSNAITYYLKALDAGYSNADIYEYLGESYYHNNDSENAIKYYEIAKSKLKDKFTGYLNLGNAYGDLGKYDKAIENYILSDKYEKLGYGISNSEYIIYRDKSISNSQKLNYLNDFSKVTSDPKLYEYYCFIYGDMQDVSNARYYANLAGRTAESIILEHAPKFINNPITGNGYEYYAESALDNLRIITQTTCYLNGKVYSIQKLYNDQLIEVQVGNYLHEYYTNNLISVAEYHNYNIELLFWIEYPNSDSSIRHTHYISSHDFIADVLNDVKYDDLINYTVKYYYNSQNLVNKFEFIYNNVVYITGTVEYSGYKTTKLTWTSITGKTRTFTDDSYDYIEYDPNYIYPTPIVDTTTPEPTIVTPVPTIVTPVPTVVTPEPTIVTPEPTVITPAPTIVTPEPTVVTPVVTTAPTQTTKNPKPSGYSLKKKPKTFSLSDPWWKYTLEIKPFNPNDSFWKNVINTYDDDDIDVLLDEWEAKYGEVEF